MTNTTNYDLIIVEGTDKVNPLTQVNPNFEIIDEEMKKNKDAAISTATELLTGSIHGLQRANGDAAVFRFTATSNYTAGDTFTVDGIQVTALTPTGEALGNGAYIIGSEVLCCLKGTLLTMFLTGGTVTTADNALKLGGEEPSYYGTATDVAQAQQTATAAGVLANSVQTQVADLKTLNNRSNDERIVGYDTDGVTPIYERSVQGAINNVIISSLYRVFRHSFDFPVDKIISVTGYSKRIVAGGPYKYPISQSAADFDSRGIIFESLLYTTGTTLNYQAAVLSSLGNDTANEFDLTIRYTKPV